MMESGQEFQSIGQIKGLSWADLLMDTSHQAWKDREQPVYHPEILPASVIEQFTFGHCWVGQTLQPRAIPWVIG